MRYNITKSKEREVITVMIRSFSDFVSALFEAGFSMGGGNSEGIYSLAPLYGTNIAWHTGNPDTDPWEWRIRVLSERNDIAYAKLFFHKSGYITKDWYPYFLAARRNGKTLEEAYADGEISNYAKRSYEIIAENGSVPVHEIKRLAGFGREDNSKFERALVELQMKMYVTICGYQQKISLRGEEYGWLSAVYCRTESLFGNGSFEQVSHISTGEAAERITEQILRLNPSAGTKEINKFIYG